MLDSLPFPQTLFPSPEEKRQIFLTQLVKAGISFAEALRVAEIIASQHDNEDLTPEDRQLVRTCCQAWLNYRKKQALIDRAVASLSYGR